MKCLCLCLYRRNRLSRVALFFLTSTSTVTLVPPTTQTRQQSQLSSPRRMSPQNSGKINTILRSHVHKPYTQNNYPEAWRNLPEIHSSEEIMPQLLNSDSDNSQEKWDDYQKEASYNPKLPFNIIDGPWGSKLEYIGAHYQILREDSVAALRRSVSYVRDHPDSMETDDTFMYTHVSGPQKLQMCGS